MPWSVGFDVGPLHYHRPVRRRPGPPAVVMVLLGFAAVGLIVAVLVLYAAAVVAAWIVGVVVGLFRRAPESTATRYATAVVAWGRDVTREWVRR